MHSCTWCYTSTLGNGYRCSMYVVCVYGSMCVWQYVRMAVCAYGSMCVWQYVRMAVWIMELSSHRA